MQVGGVGGAPALDGEGAARAQTARSRHAISRRQREFVVRRGPIARGGRPRTQQPPPPYAPPTRRAQPHRPHAGASAGAADASWSRALTVLPLRDGARGEQGGRASAPWRPRRDGRGAPGGAMPARMETRPESMTAGAARNAALCPRCPSGNVVGVWERRAPIKSAISQPCRQVSDEKSQACREVAAARPRGARRRCRKQPTSCKRAPGPQWWRHTPSFDLFY